MFVFCVVLCCGLDGGSEKGGFPRASDGNWEGFVRRLKGRNLRKM
jgi:hypothetical protein